MITYNAAEYVERSLPSLLESCDEDTRLWLWHNGQDAATLQVVEGYLDDPRIHRFHHSPTNEGLVGPTNWLWQEAKGTYVSKVDDDCLLPSDWISRLRAAHEIDEPLGVVGACRLLPEDIVPDLMNRKIVSYGEGVSLFRNHWVQGSGYLMRRSVVDRFGLLDGETTWTAYCLQLAQSGLINGFLYPLIPEDHMDDPRSRYSLLKSDDDLQWRMPLSARRSKVVTLKDWETRLRRSAYEIQAAPLDLRYWKGWRRRVRNLKSRLAEARSPKAADLPTSA